MKTFEVPIVYRGQCNFLVQADDANQAQGIAEAKWHNGEMPEDLGNEWETIERFGAVQEIDP